MTKLILRDFTNIGKYFLPPLFLFLFNWVLFFFNVYSFAEWIDIPMHIVGGSLVAFTYFFSLKYLQKRGYLKINSFTRVVFVLSLVALTAVLWEFFEFSLTYLLGTGFQGTLNDTMFDLFLGLFGGLFMAILLEKLV